MQAVALEHRYGRPILPSFHGAWTFGGLVAAASTLATRPPGPALDRPWWRSSRSGRLLRAVPRPRARRRPRRRHEVAVPWRPILLVGLALVLFYMVDTAAFTWGPTYLDRRGRRTRGRWSRWRRFPYLVASGLVRLAGDDLVHRFGAVRVLRVGAVVASGALAVIVFAPTWPVAVLGFLVLGGGVAVVAPLSFSAAARIAGGDTLDPAERRTRVDAVIARFNQFNYVGALLGAVMTGLVGAGSLRSGSPCRWCWCSGSCRSPRPSSPTRDTLRIHGAPDDQPPLVDNAINGAPTRHPFLRIPTHMAYSPFASPTTRSGQWLDPTARTERDFRPLDFALFFLLPFQGLSLPGGLPVSEVAILSVVVMAVTRRPTVGSRPLWFAVLVVFVPAWLTLSGFLNDDLLYRRLGHVALWAGLALFISSGRIPLRSAGLGLGAGLLASAAMSGLGFAAVYPGRLDGWIGDPNAAAFYLTCLGSVALSQVQRTSVRLTLALGLLTALVATWSRTGLAAAAIIALWTAFARTMGRGLGIIALVIATWSIQNFATAYLTWGPFAERAGSDNLRQRLILLEQAKLAAAPFYGGGPGSASVYLDGQSFFFHSSYLGARSEGGVLLLVAIVSVIVLTLASHLRTIGSQTPEATWTQASLIAPLVMAFTLGEVLLDLPTAVALGFTMHAVLRARAAGVEPADAASALEPAGGG